MKYFDIAMRFLTDRMPRKVAIAALVLTATAILFGILLPTLGAADGEAQDDNAHLKSSIDQTTHSLRQAQDDHQFVVANAQKYEDLMHGDRLVPHTPRVAMAQMQKLALDRGLTSLSYNFTVATERAAAANLPTKGGYQLHVEKVDLKIGAPLDTRVFDFVTDLGESFPGTAVVEQLSLERAPELTTEALNEVSRGHDSGLVKGETVFTWRTAEAVDQTNKAKR